MSKIPFITLFSPHLVDLSCLEDATRPEVKASYLSALRLWRTYAASFSPYLS